MRICMYTLFSIIKIVFYASPDVADFGDSLFSFDVIEAEAGTLLAYAILVIKQCQQQIYDFLLSCPCVAK